MTTVKGILEIGIIFLVLYSVLRFMQGTRGAGIMKGLVLIFALLFVTVTLLVRKLDLPVLGYLLDHSFTLSLFALLVIFQPELRRGLVHIGQHRFLGLIFRGEEQVEEEICAAVEHLARNKIGALIALEREFGLAGYREGGVQLDAEVKSELLQTIFWPGTALHDGAVIIAGGRLAAGGCLFPLTDNPEISKSLGTRHRAALGLTEESDALVIVVSEETGRISIASAGTLVQGLDLPELRRRLYEVGGTQRTSRGERKAS